MKEDYSWVKLFRKITEWGWWSDDAVFRFFVGIILLANYKDGEFKGQTIKRGSFITSIPNLCTYFQMSERKIRRCLKNLKESGEILDEANNHFRKITIINYNEYQDELPLTKQQGNRKGKQQGNRQDKKQDKGHGKQQSNRHPIEERKKNMCPTDTYSQEHPSRAPAGRTPAAVTFADIRQFQIDNRVGSGELVSEFYDAFTQSGTRIPDDWQQVYTRYAKAPCLAQVEFIENLTGGKYHEKWGKADAGA